MCVGIATGEAAGCDCASEQHPTQPIRQHLPAGRDDPHQGAGEVVLRPVADPARPGGARRRAEHHAERSGAEGGRKHSRRRYRSLSTLQALYYLLVHPFCGWTETVKPHKHSLSSSERRPVAQVIRM